MLGIKFHKLSADIKIEDILEESPETLINQGFRDLPLVMVMKGGFCNEIRRIKTGNACFP